MTCPAARPTLFIPIASAVCPSIGRCYFMERHDALFIRPAMAKIRPVKESAVLHVKPLKNPLPKKKESHDQQTRP